MATKNKDGEIDDKTDPDFDPEKQSVMVEVPELPAEGAEAKTKTVKANQEPAEAQTDDDQDAGVLALTEQLEAARSAQAQLQQERDEALHIARDRDMRARQAYAQTADAEYGTMQNGLGAAQAECNAARQQLRSAKETGDVDAEIEAQEKLGRAGFEIKQYEVAIAQLAEQQRQEAAYAEHQARQSRQPRQQQPQRQPTTAEIAASIEADPQLFPAEKGWLKKHPEARVMPHLQRRLQTACELATERGHARGSTEYLNTVDEIMGYQNDKTNTGRSANSGARVSAPVNRGQGGAGSQRTVPVSQDEKDIAQALGMTIQEWAENKARNAEDRKTNPQSYSH